MQVSDLPYTPTNLQNLHENYSKTSHFTRITSKNRGINSYLYTSFSLALVRVNTRVLRIAESREMITKVEVQVARDCFGPLHGILYCRARKKRSCAAGAASPHHEQAAAAAGFLAGGEETDQRRRCLVNGTAAEKRKRRGRLRARTFLRAVVRPNSYVYRRLLCV